MTEMRRSMAPARYSLDPDRGYVGDPVTVKGFLGPEVGPVYFGEVPAPTIRPEPTGVLCAAPPNDPGVVMVSVHRPNGETVTVGKFTYE